MYRLACKNLSGGGTYTILIHHIFFLSRSCGKCVTLRQPLTTKVHFTSSSILCIALQWGLIQSTKQKPQKIFLLVVMHALIIAAAKSMPQSCLACAKSNLSTLKNHPH